MGKFPDLSKLPDTGYNINLCQQDLTLSESGFRFAALVYKKEIKNCSAIFFLINKKIRISREVPEVPS